MGRETKFVVSYIKYQLAFTLHVSEKKLLTIEMENLPIFSFLYLQTKN